MAIARKVIVSANGEGLVLQTASSKTQRSSQQLLIKYADGTVSYLPRENGVDSLGSSPFFEVFGVIGELCPPTLAPELPFLGFASRPDGPGAGI
jgi:hypothetical protein